MSEAAKLGVSLTLSSLIIGRIFDFCIRCQETLLTKLWEKTYRLILLVQKLSQGMNIKPADRLTHFSEYYFSTKLRSIRAMEESGRHVINLGIGSPDMQPDESVIKTLQQSALAEGAHGYQPYQGLPEFRDAVRAFYRKHYQVEWPEASVLPLMGSKEGITHISLAYLNPGDQVLIPSLGYPTYTSVTRMVGAEPIHFPLLEEKRWTPDWAFLEKLDCSRVKLMWLNYPHMPTGTPAHTEVIRKLVAFARSRNILIGYDNPYSFILNDAPQSIFNFDGGAEVAIELNSLSKTFNMAGWRVGWAMGNEQLIRPVLQIKSNMDSGMFKPVQLAAVKALDLDQQWFHNLNEIYQKRQQLAFSVLAALKCTFSTDQCGMFVWAKCPGGDGESFSDHLLECHDIFIAPGFIFGDAGSGYIRISLCASEALLEEVYSRVK